MEDGAGSKEVSRRFADLLLPLCFLLVRLSSIDAGLIVFRRIVNTAPGKSFGGFSEQWQEIACARCLSRRDGFSGS
jgi:hypothetical protein